MCCHKPCSFRRDATRRCVATTDMRCGKRSDATRTCVATCDEMRYDARCDVRHVKARVRQIVIAPSTSVLAPVIRGEPDMVSLLLGSRELLCLVGRISRTLVRYRSLFELCLPGESVRCEIQGESVGWWSNIIFLPDKTGVFRGARHSVSMSRRVNVTSYRGSTRHVVAACRSANRYRGSTRHRVTITIPSGRFFFITDLPYSSRSHFDASPTGAPPFVELKGLATMSNMGGVVG